MINNSSQLQVEIIGLKQSLIREKEQFSAIMRAVRDGIISTDNEGKILTLNKVAEKTTGWNKNEVVGLPLMKIFQIYEEKSEKPINNPVLCLLTEGIVSDLWENALLISRDGEKKVIEYTTSLICDQESRGIGAVLIFRDLTENLRIAQEYEKNEKLESIGLLAGGIAHDFNNFLTAILSNITLAMLNLPKDHQAYDRLSEAERSILRAKALTQQLLTFAKGGAPVRKVTRIAKVIIESSNFVLSGSNSKVKFALPEDLWPVELDEGQFSQVIHNIVINADQAMPTGGIITITGCNVKGDIKLPAGLETGKYVKLTIQDQGIGIPKEYLSKIFDPYFTTKQKGSGLGLTSALAIIRKHEGAIMINSEPGNGTEVTIYLPASGKKVIPQKSEEEKGSSLKKANILLMDDDRVILHAVEALLVHKGFDVTTAGDGRETIKLYSEALKTNSQFDIVIMDLTIPGGMGGREAIHELLNINPDVKVIVSSGYSTDPIMSEYWRYGFVQVLPKPYNISELISVVEDVLKPHGREVEEK